MQSFDNEDNTWRRIVAHDFDGVPLDDDFRWVPDVDLTLQDQILERLVI